MVLINNISDPDIASCLKDVNTHNNSIVFLQVNGTVTTPSNILKAYDDDTGCRFIRSCMLFTMYLGCLPKSSEYVSGCFSYITRNNLLGMVKNETEHETEFYIPTLNTTLNQFCIVIAARIANNGDLEKLYDDEPCKYVKELGMLEPYDINDRFRDCLSTNDLREIKKTILY